NDSREMEMPVFPSVRYCIELIFWHRGRIGIFRHGVSCADWARNQIMKNMLRTFVAANTTGEGITDRRGFLKSLGVAAGAGAITLSWRDMLLARAKEMQKSGKRMILLWMDGGPSQY